MSKKKDKVVIPEPTEEVGIDEIIEQLKERSFIITAAAIKERFCNYSYEITEGIGKLNPHNVKGKQLYLDTLGSAFAAFNVHMAVIDDVFKHSSIEIDNIANFSNHEHTFLYEVTGFQIIGEDDNESIILFGSKGITSGRMDLKTPKIPIDDYSSYKWKKELKLAAYKAKLKVVLYHEGEYTEIEEEEVKPNKKQTKIIFAQPEDAEKENGTVAASVVDETQLSDEEFENAAV